MRKAFREFQHQVMQYYHEHGRHNLPWRLRAPDGSYDPYHILVSEIMLQQTQVQRVIPLYISFITKFPTPGSLAVAPLGDILKAWQGLGYNRRARYLWQTATIITSEYSGRLPQNDQALRRLPGIGANTAGAILAYAFNEPAVFIETNIRTVMIYHFFAGQTAVSDNAIAAIVRQTLDRVNPREWYWALMDYGSHVKQAAGNLSKASAAYTKQAPFHGSVRQLRGRILRQLAAGPMSSAALFTLFRDDRTESTVKQLEAEGLLCNQDGISCLPDKPADAAGKPIKA